MRGADFCYHAFFNWRENLERSGKTMADYKDMYYKLFNKLTDVIEELKEIQCEMEEIYSDANSNDAENN